MPLTLEQKLKYYHYEAKPADGPFGTLGAFFHEVYNNGEAAVEVKSVKFTLPHDSVDNSGIVNFLLPYMPTENTPTPYPPAVLAAHRLQNLCHQYALSSLPSGRVPLSKPALSRVPLKFVLETYVMLFAKACPNLEAAEFPLAWEEDLERAEITWGHKLDWNVREKDEDKGWIRYGKREEVEFGDD
ncbi:hypothetical protein CC80DRAFT_595551 [Byssothecium circinans]|uniref:Uncharacterized protein n=1 Tax=Byssothecium circinans TaxID=147558 RepID=A0A6A5TYI8_9PLEO|nr:hypothetical protein CC80DRAFT_595551 [Byssothecium circinans]